MIRSPPDLALRVGRVISGFAPTPPTLGAIPSPMNAIMGHRPPKVKRPRLIVFKRLFFFHTPL